jgi:hypothetical protein
LKQSLSSFSIFLRAMLFASVAALPSAACALNAPARGSTTRKLVAHETQGQKQSAPARKEAARPVTVETRLTELFDLCKQGDMDAAASYFVYRGPDKSREWKDTFRASEPIEKAGVEEICRRIKGYLDESQGYVFGEVKVERESEGVWHALEVSFQKEGQSKKVIFAFLKIKGQFSIGDIDE